MFVEWPEAGRAALPPARVEVTLEHSGGEGRRLVLSSPETALLQGIPDAGRRLRHRDRRRDERTGARRGGARRASSDRSRSCSSTWTGFSRAPGGRHLARRRRCRHRARKLHEHAHRACLCARPLARARHPCGRRFDARRARVGAPDVLPVIDARRREVFVPGPRVVAPDELELEPGTVCVGNGAQRYRAALERRGAVVPPDDRPAARAARGLHASLAAELGPVDAIEPVYLREGSRRRARRARRDRPALPSGSAGISTSSTRSSVETSYLVAVVALDVRASSQAELAFARRRSAETASCWGI